MALKNMILRMCTISTSMTSLSGSCFCSKAYSYALLKVRFWNWYAISQLLRYSLRHSWNLMGVIWFQFSPLIAMLWRFCLMIKIRPTFKSNTRYSIETRSKSRIKRKSTSSDLLLTVPWETTNSGLANQLFNISYSTKTIILHRSCSRVTCQV